MRYGHLLGLAYVINIVYCKREATFGLLFSTAQCVRCNTLRATWIKWKTQARRGRVAVLNPKVRSGVRKCMTKYAECGAGLVFHFGEKGGSRPWDSCPRRTLISINGNSLSFFIFRVQHV